MKPIHYLTEHEKVFQKELKNILENAKGRMETYGDLYTLYLELTSTIESVFIRKEIIYPELFNRQSPDYTNILCDLEVLRGRVRDKITSKIFY